MIDREGDGIRPARGTAGRARRAARRSVLRAGLLTASVLAWAIASGCATTSASGPAADLVIENARIVSPPLAVRENATLVVRGGRIAQIEDGPLELVSGRRIDARGRTVIPGLIDTHVHLQLAAFPDATSYSSWTRDAGQALLDDYVRHGFTTILSVGDYWPGITEIRRRSKRPGQRSPRVLVSGPILTPRGGHGTLDFPDCHAVAYCREHGFARVVGSEDEARAVVAELAAGGVDGIKIAHDGSEIAYPTEERMGRFPPGVIAAIVEAAHARKLPVRVHAYPVAFAREAVEAGVDALVHGPGLIRVGGSAEGLDALLDLLAQRNVPVATTLSIQGYVEDAWGVERDVPFGRTELVPYLKEDGSLHQALEDARRFARHGVTLAFGTDIMAMRRPGEAALLELEKLHEAGFSNAEILEIATLNAARFVGRADEVGSIEPGKLADLVIVSADPLATHRFVERVDVVIREGLVVYEFGP